MVLVSDVCVFVAILLGSIKVPYDEIRRRILEVDEEKLDVAVVEQLIRYLPEPEQMKQLTALKDEYATLAPAEQFGVMVSNCIHFVGNVMAFHCDVQGSDPDA